MKTLEVTGAILYFSDFYEYTKYLKCLYALVLVISNVIAHLYNIASVQISSDHNNSDKGMAGQSRVFLGTIRKFTK